MTTTDDAYWLHRRTPAHRRFREARDLLLTHREDREAAVAAFRWPRPDRFNWALEWFDVVAADNHRPALQLGHGGARGRTVSYADLSAGSDRTANWLRARGVRRGDRVLLVLGQQLALWECLLACLKLGAVVVPTYTTLTASEARDRLRRGRIDHVICRAELAELFDPPPAGLRAVVHDSGPGPDGPVQVPAGWTDYDDRLSHPDRFLPEQSTDAGAVAFCYFTSGTTSAPKLVAHTHTSYPIGHLSSLYWNGLRPGDRHLNVSAPGWAKHSWSSLFVPFNAEATLVVPPDGAFEPASLPGFLTQERVTTMCAPPSAWQAVRPHLSSARPALREATSAGEPLPDAVVHDVAAAWDVVLRDGYGQTEATALIGTTPALRRVPGSIGLPLPGYRIALLDADGRENPEQGELAVAVDATGPAGLMAGYLDEHGQQRSPAADGWYRTGDLAVREPAGGHLTLLGRTDDVFKSFDHRISPYELEAVLKSHPAVADAAVIPRPHPVGGATPHAVVLLATERSPGAGELDAAELDAAELLRFCAARLAPELRPRSVEFAPELPRTTSGKIRRQALVAARGPADWTPLHLDAAPH